MSFLDAEISRENGKFVTTVYCKATFGCGYTHFESSLPSTHKFCVLYTLVYRCFNLYSDWTEFHRELVTLNEIFQRTGYLTLFIDNFLKKFLNRLHMIKPTLATVEEKPLHLVLPYLGPISLQVRTKIINATRWVLNCCKLQVIFKSERKLSNMFRLKDYVPYDLVSGAVYEYTCGRCNFCYFGERETLKSWVW